MQDTVIYVIVVLTTIVCTLLSIKLKISKKDTITTNIKILYLDIEKDMIIKTISKLDYLSIKESNRIKLISKYQDKLKIILNKIDEIENINNTDIIGISSIATVINDRFSKIEYKLNQLIASKIKSTQPHETDKRNIKQDQPLQTLEQTNSNEINKITNVGSDQYIDNINNDEVKKIKTDIINTLSKLEKMELE